MLSGSVPTRARSTLQICCFDPIFRSDIKCLSEPLMNYSLCTVSFLYLALRNTTRENNCYQAFKFRCALLLLLLSLYPVIPPGQWAHQLKSTQQDVWYKGVINTAECRPLPCALETSAHHRLCLVNWVSRQRGSREVYNNMRCERACYMKTNTNTKQTKLNHLLDRGWAQESSWFEGMPPLVASGSDLPLCWWGHALRLTAAC